MSNVTDIRDNEVIISKEQMIKNAVEAMESCVGWLASIKGKVVIDNIDIDTRNSVRVNQISAALNRGEARTWEEILLECFDYDLCEENEHYNSMIEVWSHAIGKETVK